MKTLCLLRHLLAIPSSRVRHVCAYVSAWEIFFKFVDVLSALSIFRNDSIFLSSALRNDRSAKHPPCFSLPLCGSFLAGVKGLVIFPGSVTSVDRFPSIPLT